MSSPPWDPRLGASPFPGDQAHRRAQSPRVGEPRGAQIWAPAGTASPRAPAGRGQPTACSSCSAQRPGAALERPPARHRRDAVVPQGAIAGRSAACFKTWTHSRRKLRVYFPFVFDCFKKGFKSIKVKTWQWSYFLKQKYFNVQHDFHSLDLFKADYIGIFLRIVFNFNTWLNISFPYKIWWYNLSIFDLALSVLSLTGL
jgi:hypothetical protein